MIVNENEYCWLCLINLKYFLSTSVETSDWLVVWLIDCVQAEARRNRVKEARKRRDDRQETKKKEMLQVTSLLQNALKSIVSRETYIFKKKRNDFWIHILSNSSNNMTKSGLNFNATW